MRCSFVPPAPLALRRVLTGLLVCATLCGAGLGSARAEEAPDTSSFRSLRDQGIHYHRRKMPAPALQALRKADAAPGGREDYKTQLYLARLAYEELVLEDSFPAARRAVDLAPGEEERERAQALLAELEASFGGVTFRQDPDQKTDLKETYIQLKDKGGLINVKKKQVFQRIQARFESTRVRLPITLYLPFGSYTANGAPFVAEQGKMAEALLYMYLEQPGISWWWYAGAAVAVAGGTTALLLLLSGDDEVVQSARYEPIRLVPEP